MKKGFRRITRGVHMPNLKVLGSMVEAPAQRQTRKQENKATNNGSNTVDYYKMSGLKTLHFKMVSNKLYCIVHFVQFFASIHSLIRVSIILIKLVTVPVMFIKIVYSKC